VTGVSRLLLYARTVRRLRPRQIVMQIARRLQSTEPGPLGAPVTVHDRGMEAIRRAAVAIGPLDMARRRERANTVLNRDFTFVGEMRHLDPVDWKPRHVSHLWSYNLHYFEYFVDLAWLSRETGDAGVAADAVGLASSWIDANGGPDGWEPYALSCRIINWIVATALLDDLVSSETRMRIGQSLAHQSRFLRRRIEWQVDGNHLLKNLTALCLAGWVLDDEECRENGRWAQGQLIEAVREQFLDDGCHVERSSMYHLLVLSDLLLVTTGALELGEREVHGSLNEVLVRGAQAATAFVRDDGSLSLFNDSAEDIAFPVGAIVDATHRVTGTRVVRSRAATSHCTDRRGVLHGETRRKQSRSHGSRRGSSGRALAARPCTLRHAFIRAGYSWAALPGRQRSGRLCRQSISRVRSFDAGTQHASVE
jgi:hypothetical protein